MMAIFIQLHHNSNTSVMSNNKPAGPQVDCTYCLPSFEFFNKEKCFLICISSSSVIISYFTFFSNRASFGVYPFFSRSLTCIQVVDVCFWPIFHCLLSHIIISNYNVFVASPILSADYSADPLTQPSCFYLEILFWCLAIPFSINQKNK